jgi:hypothetical protein
MDVLVTYKVSNNENGVREAMREKGYFFNWKARDLVYELPISCVWKPDITLEIAKKDLQAVVAQLANKDHTFELYSSIIVSASIWAGIPNQ